MKNMIKCEACSKEFKPRKKTSKYCSADCYQNHGMKKSRPDKRIERVVTECNGCGKDFTHKVNEVKKYCSFRCYRNSNRSEDIGHSRVCKNCGNDFVNTLKNQTCCSKKCSIDSLIKGNDGVPVEPRECRTCGISFKPRENNRYHCSSECYREAGKERRLVNCLVCGISFKRKSIAHTLCSVECRTKSNEGEDNGHFKGYIHRNNGYLRYSPSHPDYPRKYVHTVLWWNVNPNGKCERCSGEVEHVHHKDRDKANNLLTNLEGLCVSCHRKEHSKENELKFQTKSILK